MKLDRVIVPASVAIAAIGGGVAYFGRDKVMPVVRSILPGGLSPLRKRIINEIIPRYVPSTYGDERFARLMPGYEVHAENGKLVQTFNGVVLPENFTTCGGLPCRVGYDLGVKNGITQCGLDAMRANGKAAGAWAEPGGKNRPRPGDFYGLCNSPGGIITHVGVIIDASGKVWRMADAGQGPHDKQAAAYVERAYDPAAMTLGGPAGARLIAGWLDIDEYMAGRPIV